MLVTNRTDIDVPKEYIRSFEVPDGLEGEDLCEAVKQKIESDWSYLDLRCAKLRHACLYCADLRYTDLRYSDLTSADLWGADFTFADLWGADLWGADFNDAKNVDFSGTIFTSHTKHERIILVPEIEWAWDPIAAVMPEGKQPLLISIGCQTHTPEVWAAFTTDQLRRMDVKAPEWYEAHMETTIKKSRELEAEWRKKC